MPFSTRLTVNFGDTDPAGLVYFPNIFHYCHIAMERFFAEVCGVAYSRLIEEQRLGFPTVKIDAEFTSPLRYGDWLDIEVEVVEVGNKSMSIVHRVKNHQGVVCSEVTQVVVAMDLTNHQSVNIPDSIRERLTVL
jgi:4-hydroxybenzoyl-CoA thioesterase